MIMDTLLLIFLAAGKRRNFQGPFNHSIFSICRKWKKRITLGM